MLLKKAVGRNGATLKYDLISVLGAHGLAGGKAGQRVALRLISLITARYNWQTDELSVGQTEIARLWSVDTRTVKREMAQLRDCGWLIEKRAAARGRVTLYGLGIARIMVDTRWVWPMIGSDLVARLDGPAPDAPIGNVVAFPSLVPFDPSLWGRTKAAMQGLYPAIYGAWIAALTLESLTDGTAIFHAPSAFHATYVTTNLAEKLLAGLQSHDRTVRRVWIRS